MVKLIALYRTPENAEAFDSHYFDDEGSMQRALASAKAKRPPAI
jgi:hypothetical protein